MVRHLACVHVGNDDLRHGRVGDAIRRVLEMRMPPPPPLDGADRAAERLLGILG
jgi:hypothetical protein